MDEFNPVMSVVHELHSWGPANHIRSNLWITAGILGTPDEVVHF